LNLPEVFCTKCSKAERRWGRYKFGTDAKEIAMEIVLGGDMLLLRGFQLEP
jgi:hypothetical protein